MKKKDSKALDREIRGALLEDVEWMTTVVASQWKKIIAGGIAIVIAVGVFYSMSLNADRKAARAASVLGDAATEAELTSALAEYPDYAASNYARLKLARLYVGAKKYDAAREQFRLISANGASEDVLNRMRIDEAYMTELAGDRKAAVAAFRAVAESVSDSLVRAEALYCAGRLELALGEKAAAKQLLGQASAVQSETPSPFQGLAHSLLLGLKD